MRWIFQDIKHGISLSEKVTGSEMDERWRNAKDAKDAFEANYKRCDGVSQRLDALDARMTSTRMPVFRSQVVLMRAEFFR